MSSLPFWQPSSPREHFEKLTLQPDEIHVFSLILEVDYVPGSSSRLRFANFQQLETHKNLKNHQSFFASQKLVLFSHVLQGVTMHDPMVNHHLWPLPAWTIGRDLCRKPCFPEHQIHDVLLTSKRTMSFHPQDRLGSTTWMMSLEVRING